MPSRISRLLLLLLASAFVGCGPPDGYRAAETAYANGEYEKAIELFTKAAETSDNPAIYGNRGNCYSSLGDIESALKDYETGIEKATQATGNPNDPSLAYFYFNRGYACERAGRFKQAIADYEKTISLDAKYPDVKNNLGWFLATCPEKQFRNPKRALEVATLACEANDWKDGNIIDTLAAAHAAAGNFEKAIELQEKAISLVNDPESIEALTEHLMLYRQKKPFVDSLPDSAG